MSITVVAFQSGVVDPSGSTLPQSGQGNEQRHQVAASADLSLLS
jgi:hypothetical protein